MKNSFKLEFALVVIFFYILFLLSSLGRGQVCDMLCVIGRRCVDYNSSVYCAAYFSCEEYNCSQPNVTVDFLFQPQNLTGVNLVFSSLNSLIVSQQQNFTSNTTLILQPNSSFPFTHNTPLLTFLHTPFLQGQLVLQIQFPIFSDGNRKVGVQFYNSFHTRSTSQFIIPIINFPDNFTGNFESLQAVLSNQNLENCVQLSNQLVQTNSQVFLLLTLDDNECNPSSFTSGGVFGIILVSFTAFVVIVAIGSVFLYRKFGVKKAESVVPMQDLKTEASSSANETAKDSIKVELDFKGEESKATPPTVVPQFQQVQAIPATDAKPVEQVEAKETDSSQHTKSSSSESDYFELVSLEETE